jgi:hypothetical protein
VSHHELRDHTQSIRHEFVGPEVTAREPAMNEPVADAESTGLCDQDPEEIRGALRLARRDRNRP